MAEVLATFGSVAAMSRLAGQVIVCTQKLYHLWNQFKDAPKQVADLLNEIRMYAQTLENLPSQKHAALSGSLVHSKQVMSELQELLTEFTGHLENIVDQRRLLLGSVKFVLRSNVLKSLVGRLERATSYLIAANTLFLT